LREAEKHTHLRRRREREKERPCEWDSAVGLLIIIIIESMERVHESTAAGDRRDEMGGPARNNSSRQDLKALSSRFVSGSRSGKERGEAKSSWWWWWLQSPPMLGFRGER
jgi:hypothetical protein